MVVVVVVVAVKVVVVVVVVFVVVVVLVLVLVVVVVVVVVLGAQDNYNQAFPVLMTRLQRGQLYLRGCQVAYNQQFWPGYYYPGPPSSS